MARLQKDTVKRLKRIRDEGGYDSVDEAIQGEIGPGMDSLQSQVEELQTKVDELNDRSEKMKDFVREQTVGSDTG